MASSQSGVWKTVVHHLPDVDITELNTFKEVSFDGLLPKLKKCFGINTNGRKGRERWRLTQI